MGLSLDLSLFYDADPQQVYEACERHFRVLGKRITSIGESRYSYDLYEKENGWTVLTIGRMITTREHEEEALSVSRDLGCSGFCLKVYDGDYWNYSLVRKGGVIDRHTSDATKGGDYDPIYPAGDVESVVQTFPWLRRNDVAPYLVQDPRYIEWVGECYVDGLYQVEKAVAYLNEYEKRNVPARLGDEFNRWSECAIIDFMRMLGVRVGMPKGCVAFPAPLYRVFYLENPRYIAGSTRHSETGTI